IAKKEKNMAFLKNNEPKLDYGEEAFVNKIAIRPLVAANCTDYVVAHSNAALRPIRQISEVFLLPHILEVMHKLGLNRLLRIQSHTWPHLVVDRGHGAMVVAAPHSGRTLSYIPPVCDVVCRAILDAKKVKLDHLSESPLLGALAVILVPDLERVRHVGALCNAFVRKICHSKTFTPVLGIPSNENPEFFHRLFNGVGCLVATPAQLVWIMKDRTDLMQFKHLKVIVYDDIDLMVPEMLTKAEEVLKLLMPMDRSHPQLVMVSQSYDPGQMAKLKLLNSNPALIFGDMLEAAMYGEMRLRIALCPEQAKINEVLKLLQLRPPKDYRTVILCSDDANMRRLVRLLEEEEEEEKHYYSCLPYYQDANLEVGEQVHSWLKETRGIILLATDNCPELSIRHAHTLIHYSMSDSWSKFKMRHLAIADNLTNRLDRDTSSRREKTKGLPLYSLVLLDDTNQKELPRLVDFAKKYQPVDDAIVAVARQIRQQLTKLHCNQNVLCRQIMLLGDCINSLCEERHHADHLDRPTALVPASGDIKVLLVRVYSPTHFCVHLLEHLPPGQSWKSFPSPPVQQMRLQLMQGDSSSKERYWPPIAGAVCLCRTAVHKIRVRVLKVEPIKNVNLTNINLKVLVQALDEDTRIFSVRSGQLYKCPEELQAESPMAIDLRLFGMVPHSGERDWSEEDRRAIELKLRNLPKECFLQANIQFATAHTIFVRNLMAISYAKSLKIHVQQFNLGRHLTETQLAKSCQQAKNKILAIFEDETTTVLDPVKLKNAKQSEPKVEVEEKVQLKEETKENNPPNQMGFKCVWRNRLARELKLLEEEEQEAKELSDMPKPLEQKEDKETAEQQLKQTLNNEGISQLLQCINNIAALQLEDTKATPEEDQSHMLLAASKFLDHIDNGNQTSVNGKPKKSHKKKDTKKDSADFKAIPQCNSKMQLQLPANVARPPTTYYQTLTTLELQVLLPDDGYKYTALLDNNLVLFHANHPSSEIRYQFQLSMGVPYGKLIAYMRGRTVYLSVKKLVAMPDPLNFHAYHRFLKPNHEKYGQLDKCQEEQVEKFTEYAKRMALKEMKYEDLDEEESADEDRNMDGIERGDFIDY
ncbi:hypothetical protein KR032_000555, partial [Drosophila birchii]